MKKKKVHILMYSENQNSAGGAPIAVFDKKPSNRELMDHVMAETPHGVQEQFDNGDLYWERSPVHFCHR